MSRGTVDLASADTADLPLINPNFLTHPTDVEVAVAGFKRSRQLMASKAVAPVIIGEEYFPGSTVQSDDEIIAWLRKASMTVFHAACTCAMGKRSDPKAVIDSQAKVIGVSKLRVVDASSFPILVPGHPMATICKLVLSNLLFDTNSSRCTCREDRGRHAQELLETSTRVFVPCFSSHKDLWSLEK